MQAPASAASVDTEVVFIRKVMTNHPAFFSPLQAQQSPSSSGIHVHRKVMANNTSPAQVVFKEQRRYSTHRMIYALTKEQYDEAVEEMEAPEL